MKNDVVTIVNGSFAKRILAVIMDGVFAIFIALFLASLVFTPIANAAFGYSKINASQYRYHIASKLRIVYDEAEDGTRTIYDLKDLGNASSDYKDMMLYEYETDDIEFYKVRIKYYYLNYKTGQNIEHPEGVDESEYRAPNYDEEIDGKKPIEIYTEDWFNEKFGSLTTPKEFKNAAYDATSDLCNSPYYLKMNKQIKWIQAFIVMPAFVIGFAGFFIVPPLCFKNGETFGKKVMNLALVAKDGYTVKKRQIVLRQITLFLYVFLCSFVVGVGYTSIATLFLGVFIYFAATLISKPHRSPLDYLAYTLVVDSQKSVWFRDEFEEHDKTKELEANLKKYSEKPIENKNIIQIGGEIVNEDLKKEIEAENKKKE